MIAFYTQYLIIRLNTAQRTGYFVYTIYDTLLKWKYCLKLLLIKDKKTKKNVFESFGFTNLMKEKKTKVLKIFEIRKRKVMSFEDNLNIWLT